jgi:ATP-binding cassette subfamily D (ALD) protein 3
LRGDSIEKKNMNKKFFNLMRLYNYENRLRFYMGILDSTLIKYGSFNVGMAILALPVFGPDKEKYLARVSNDPALIMKDYEQNSSLLVNLAKAIGKIVISYKKLQQLAGTTSRVSGLLDVLDDLLVNGRYSRQLVANKELIYDEDFGGCALDKGKVWNATLRLLWSRETWEEPAKSAVNLSNEMQTRPV